MTNVEDPTVIGAVPCATLDTNVDAVIIPVT